jgi:hypothetical protein
LVGVWAGTRADAQILDYHNSKPYTILFIDGNNEKFDALERFPVEDWNGGRVPSDDALLNWSQILLQLSIFFPEKVRLLLR